MVKRVFHTKEIDCLIGILNEKREDCPVVTVNGCFDILTPGHLHILRQAWTKSFLNKGVVVVGLNSDKSIRKLKGDNRPILNEEERASILLLTYFVDFVYIYDEETSEDFVRMIKPAFHFNDSSYGAFCIESNVLKEFGGELILVDKIDPHLSTTEIINRILNK